ncbi:MAG: ABC transporter permease [Ectothiorhodospiraceae bacterium]|jgi:ABC-2 type transport system permease protein|nr:ABC transporter permease [Ectothiorhodospiraceae bacterium]
MTAREQYIAYQTIVIKEILRFARIWLQTILPPAITTALYFIIFGGLIGPRIGDMEGVPYMQYIVPGLIMMTVITNSYANVVSSFYGSKFQHHIEEMLVSPIPNHLIILGFVTGGLARGMAVGITVTLVSLLFTEFSVHSLTVMLSITVLTAVLFSLAGMINAIFANSFDDISIVPTFVLTPLTYLGGVFYSINMLPEFWQDASLLNPILYMVDAFRFGMLGVSDIRLGLSYTIILGFIALLYSVTLYLMNKGVGIRH